MKKNQITNKEYYISIEDKKKGFIVYTSDPFFLTEFDLLSLIKICYVRKRNKIVGKKLIEIYKDSTKERIDLTNMRLKAIGVIEPNEKKPTTTTRKNPRTK